MRTVIVMMCVGALFFVEPSADTPSWTRNAVAVATALWFIIGLCIGTGLQEHGYGSTQPKRHRSR